MRPHPHEEFIRLSALAIAGDLTPEEQIRLDAHLSECEQCRVVHQQYLEVATEVLPILGVEIAPEPDDAPGSADWSLADAERRLMRTIDERAPAPSRDQKKAFKKNLLLSAAAFAVASAGGIGY